MAKAAAKLDKDNIGADVLDLRTIRPLDMDAILKTVEKTNRVVYREVTSQPQEARLDSSLSGRLCDQLAVAEERYPMAAARQAEQEMSQRDLPTTPLGRTVVGDDSQRCSILARHGRVLFTFGRLIVFRRAGILSVMFQKCLGHSNTFAGHSVPEPL